MRPACTVSEPMTWSEICVRFPQQWIALIALDWTDDRDEPYRTALIAGSGTRREAMAQARPLVRLFSPLGPFFTGDPPPAATALPPVVCVA